jgi:hypothetical protein
MNVRMKELDIQEKWVARWNGQLPSTMIPGSALPMFNIHKE